jgi:hypothetical protein
MINKIKTSIFLVLSYLFVFGQTVALAQSTAAILPQGRTQFLDNNGNPLSSGKIYFYIPNTLTNKTTWQDAAKTTANTNPVILDAGGRATIYGDGTYRQQVRTSANTLIYDAVTASAGTGGGTTGTGDGDLVGTIKPWAGLLAPNQYAFAYGQEVSRTTYSVLFTAITTQQTGTCVSGSPTINGFSDTSQIPVGGVVESICLPAGSLVVTKTASSVTFNNNATVSTSDTIRFFLYGNGNSTTTFNLPDLRGRAVAGRDNMGGTSANRLTTAFYGVSGDGTGAVGGSQSHTLITANLPPYTPAGTAAYTPAGTVTTSTPSGTISTPTITNAFSSTGTNSYTPSGLLSGSPAATITDPGHFHSPASGGGGFWVSGGGGFAVAGGAGTSAVNTDTKATGISASTNLASGGVFTGIGITLSSTSSTPTFTGNAASSTFTGTPGAPVFTGTAQGGTSTAFAIVQPTMTLNWIIKITPDSNSADASGVTSIQGMTGDIACGTGMLCTGNIINSIATSVETLLVDVTAPPYNAACDGVTNDVSAFNNALLAANSAGGGTVTAPYGRICTIQSGSSINLQTNTGIDGNFTLRGTSATNNTEMILAINKSNVWIKNITIDMINSFVNLNNNNAGISVLNATNLLVQGVNIINQGNMGIIINGASSYKVLSNNITMNSPYGSGHQTQSLLVSISGSTPTSGIISNNVFDGAGLNLVTANTQITNNKIKNMRYGGGIGISSLNAGGAICDFSPCPGNIIANNEVSGGVGIDDIGTIVLGIEIFDRRGIVTGNRVWNNAGEGIHGGAATISNNVVYDNCNYIVTLPSNPPCAGLNTRKDIDDGSDTIWANNRVFNSFGATLNVTGTQNVAGVIRIIVASTSGVAVGQLNTTAPCQVRNVGGTTNANNGWAQCKVIDATHIELTGSVFNSAWTSGGTIGGLQDYSYQETNATLLNVQLVGNSFGPGFLGTTNILATGSTNSSPQCAGICGVSNGAIMVGIQPNNLWVPRLMSGHATMNNTGVVTVTPPVGNITGLGTGVATALGVNVGTAGSFVVNGGALGSPSSAGTLPAHTLGGTVTGNSQNMTGLNIFSATSITATSSTSTPLIAGGNGAASTLALESTSGVGTTDAILFLTASQVERGRIVNDGGIVWPAAVTGGSKGAGTINATGLYQANVQVATLTGTEELTNKTLTSSVGKGTWTASGTWTLPAHTWGGAVSGGGNQLNNAVIGNVTPLAGTFTSLAATNGTFGPAGDAVSASVTAGALARVASLLSPSMSNDQRVYITLGTANSSGNSMFFGYNHHSTAASRYFAVQAFEAGFGTALNVYADGGVSVGVITSLGSGTINANSYVKTGVVAVGSLPTCNAAAKGARHFVNDSNAASFTAGIGAIVAAGGATNVPVVCDGTNWRIG